MDNKAYHFAHFPYKITKVKVMGKLMFKLRLYAFYVK